MTGDPSDDTSSRPEMSSENASNPSAVDGAGDSGDGSSPQRLLALAEFRDLPDHGESGAVRVERLIRVLAPMLEEVTPRGAAALQSIIDRHSDSAAGPADDERGVVSNVGSGLSLTITTLADLAEDLASAGLPSAAASVCGYANVILRQSGDAGAPTSDRSSPATVSDPSLGASVARLSIVTGLLAMRLGLLDDADRIFHAAAKAAEDGGSVQELANAHLNIANVHRYRDDPREARAAAETAKDHYRSGNDAIGHAMALLTLSSIATERGDLVESDDLLSQAEASIVRLRNPDLLSSVHGQRGRNLAEAGRTSAAEAAFQKSLRGARRARNIDKQAAALHSLASLAHNSGQSKLAVRRFRAVARFVERHELVQRRLQIYPSLVQILAASGHRRDALETARQFHQMNLDLGRPTGTSRALLAAALLDNDFVHEGCEQAELAVDDLRSLDPDAMWASNLRNLISGLGAQGRLRASWARVAALTHAQGEGPEDSPPLLPAVNPRESAGLLLNLAFALATEVDPALRTSEGRSSSADLDPDQAQPAEPEGAPGGAAFWSNTVEGLYSDALTALPRGERAWEALVAESQLGPTLPQVRARIIGIGLESARAHEQPIVERQLLNDLAITFSEMGDLVQALTQLETNARAAHKADDIESERIAQYNLAETLRRLDRPEDALDRATRAVELAGILGDGEDFNECRLRLGQVLTDLGRLAESRTEIESVLSSPTASAHLVEQATASLGRVHYALGNYAESATLYRRAAQTEDPRTIQFAETLIALCDALAHLGDGRSFERRLQQWVDVVQSNRFDTEWAVASLVRISMAWAEQGRSTLSGEVLGLLILLALNEAQSEDQNVRDGPTERPSDGKATEVIASRRDDTSTDDSDSMDRAGLAIYIAGQEVQRQRAAGADADSTVAALQEQIQETAGAEIALQVVELVLRFAAEIGNDTEDGHGDSK